ncbi:MAG: hypothetical protein LBH00_13165 [Planctomycetaceae bacterium]|jgi:hypothetical protein|nr:hypothetical protein [Planctomycetaceae bacterium]
MTFLPQNNRILCWIGRAALVLAVIAAGFSAGTLTAADELGSPTGRISRINPDDDSDNAENRSQKQSREDPRPLLNLFSTLRFWEKDKKKEQKPAAAHPHTDTAGGEILVPADVPVAGSLPKPATRNSAGNTRTNKKTETPADSNAAPEPPPNPYFERTAAANTAAPLYDRNGNSAALQKEHASASAYAFDVRDWVDSYPAHEEEAPVINQRTSLRTPLENPASEPAPPTGSEWNGSAVSIADLSRQKPAAAAPPQKQPHDGKAAAIDLSPSYQKHLPYVKTHGVLVVQANFPLTDIDLILNEYNLLQNDLRRYIGVPEAKEKIELCVFKDEKSYKKFLQNLFPDAPDNRRALYIKLNNKPGTLLVQRTGDYEVDLRHEMTHAIIHASIPIMPIWLDEGLAKYFEVPAAQRAEKNPYMSQVKWGVKFGMVPALNRLIKLETADEMGTKEYRESWAWTHFLIHHSRDTHQMLAAYLQMLAKWSQNLSPRQRQHPKIPSLKLYLDDIMPEQREAFKVHFGAGTE